MQLEIVRYQKDYREDLRRICFETGFAGSSLEKIIDNKNLFLDLSTYYYLDADLGITFIAKGNEKIAGYISACTNKKQYDRFQRAYFMKRIFIDLLNFHQLTKRDFKFYSSYFVSYLKGEFKSPEMPDYPAMLHINVDPSFHGKGIGSMLMNALFEYLRGIDCQGVHLKTTSLNNNALFFFQKMGFKKLYSRRTSFYNKYGFKDTENLVLGKILT